MTHLLQTFDVSANESHKNIEKRKFINYFMSVIANKILQDPRHSVTTLSVDLELSKFNPLHLGISIKI